MVKNIIFDVDGTLWDSSETILKAWNIVFSRRGLPQKRLSEIRACMGLTREAIAGKIFPSLPEEAREELVGECLETQKDLLAREGGKLYPGVRETLPLLFSRFGLYIVSNCECGYIEGMLSFCSLERFFRGFLCAGMTGLEKGDNLRLLREKYVLDGCVYVGDTRTDELACRRAGIPFVWASYGFGKAESPAAIVGSFSEIAEKAGRF